MKCLVPLMAYSTWEHPVQGAHCEPGGAAVRARVHPLHFSHSSQVGVCVFGALAGFGTGFAGGGLGDPAGFAGLLEGAGLGLLAAEGALLTALVEGGGLRLGLAPSIVSRDCWMLSNSAAVSSGASSSGWPASSGNSVPRSGGLGVGLGTKGAMGGFLEEGDPTTVFMCLCTLAGCVSCLRTSRVYSVSNLGRPLCCERSLWFRSMCSLCW
mmetsp:Transcript_36990/g.80585  ORF Transcript_36990/g.80585 Transcript_36990/m.80585 type:complete len:211 (+) Transcript_36990:1058-1690(+)